MGSSVGLCPWCVLSDMRGDCASCLALDTEPDKKEPSAVATLPPDWARQLAAEQPRGREDACGLSAVRLLLSVEKAERGTCAKKSR